MLRPTIACLTPVQPGCLWVIVTYNEFHKQGIAHRGRDASRESNGAVPPFVGAQSVGTARTALGQGA